MSNIKKIFFSFFAIILFDRFCFSEIFIYLLLEVLYYGTLLLITLILLIINTVVFIFNERRQLSTNILIILLSIMLIPSTQLFGIANSLTYFYHPFLSEGDMTPAKKMGYAEMLLTGHISSDALLEDYRKETKGNLTFYMPEDDDYGKWMELVSEVQADNRELRNDLWEETLSDEVRIQPIGPSKQNY